MTGPPSGRPLLFCFRRINEIPVFLTADKINDRQNYAYTHLPNRIELQTLLRHTQGGQRFAAMYWDLINYHRNRGQDHSQFNISKQ